MKTNSHYTLSISDLMMGLVFIFIIILMKFILDSQKEKVNYQKQKVAYHKQEDMLLQPLKERRKLIKTLKAQLKKENIKAEIDTEHGVLTLTDLVSFNKGQYQLTVKERNNLEKIKDIFWDVLFCYSHIESSKMEKKLQKINISVTDKRKSCNKNHPKKDKLIDSILIEGYADATGISPYSSLRLEGINDNIDLAMKRARSMFDFLLEYQEATSTSPESGNHLSALVNKQEKPLFGITSYGNLRSINASRSINNVTSKSDKKIGKSKDGRIDKSDRNIDESKDRRIDFRFIMSQSEDLQKELTKQKELKNNKVLSKSGLQKRFQLK